MKMLHPQNQLLVFSKYALFCHWKEWDALFKRNILGPIYLCVELPSTEL